MGIPRIPPDGAVIFDGLDLTAGPSRTGLIGANGYGKSSLLRLIAGDPTPTRDGVHVAGSLGYLRQVLTLDARLPVGEVLGIARTRWVISRRSPPPTAASTGGGVRRAC